MSNHAAILKTLSNMKSRCYNLNDKKYAHYGAKGVTVYRQWLNNAISFVTWSEQNGWTPGKHLHRIDSANGYTPENCRWLTRDEHVSIHGGEAIRYALSQPTSMNGSQHHCFHCGWTWTPRPSTQQHGTKPAACPRCGSRKWETPRNTTSRLSGREDEGR